MQTGFKIYSQQPHIALRLFILFRRGMVFSLLYYSEIVTKSPHTEAPTLQNKANSSLKVWRQSAGNLLLVMGRSCVLGCNSAVLGSLSKN